jgi:hypothetical protein
MDLMEARKIVIDHFPLHEREEVRTALTASWKKNGLKLTLGFFLGNWVEYSQPFNFVANYSGEKVGFYFAWLVHYTAWLAIPAIIGLIFFIL